MHGSGQPWRRCACGSVGSCDGGGGGGGVMVVVVVVVEGLRTVGGVASCGRSQSASRDSSEAGGGGLVGRRAEDITPTTSREAGGKNNQAKLHVGEQVLRNRQAGQRRWAASRTRHEGPLVVYTRSRHSHGCILALLAGRLAGRLGRLGRGSPMTMVWFRFLPPSPAPSRRRIAAPLNGRARQTRPNLAVRLHCGCCCCCCLYIRLHT